MGQDHQIITVNNRERNTEKVTAMSQDMPKTWLAEALGPP